jgi:creatinine amidohydrolase
MEEMSWPEFQEAVEQFPVAIVPVGALEPHGRHAPLGTDPFIADAIAVGLAEATGAIVHPYLPVGPMDVLYEFLHVPGAISIDAEVVISLVVNVGRELVRNGVKQIVLVNGHGPNAAPLTLAAFRIRRESGAYVGVLEWWSAAGDVVNQIKGFAYATHGDEIETSLAMASDVGDHVFLENAVVNPLHLEGLDADERELYLRKLTFTRRMDERYVGTSGNMGDPTRATAEKGRQIILATVEVGKKLISVLASQDADGR